MSSRIPFNETLPGGVEPDVLAELVELLSLWAGGEERDHVADAVAVVQAHDGLECNCLPALLVRPEYEQVVVLGVTLLWVCVEFLRAGHEIRFRRHKHQGDGNGNPVTI